MKNDIVWGLFTLLLLVLVCAIAQGKMLNTRAKRAAELRRQHERLIDHKVRLQRGKRFDCPACGSVEACKRCRLDVEDRDHPRAGDARPRRDLDSRRAESRAGDSRGVPHLSRLCYHRHLHLPGEADMK